jgi:3',5'-nucleoside bisphosphate phosphatase
MKYYYDLHIHSVLSSCADDLMTPNNIFNMANLKGLNIISVTDHNSLKQIKILHEISKSYDMLFIPGVEISTIEGFHILAYFKNIKDALSFDELLENLLDKQRYDQEKYGVQEITNIYDEVITEYPFLLSKNLNLSLHDLVDLLKNIDHILVYAHIDRKSNSGIDMIHLIKLDAVEVTKHVNKNFISDHQLENFKIIINSDAHTLIDILEKDKFNQIELESLTIEAFFKYFKNG